MTTETTTGPTFRELNLIPPLIKALDDVGYESPSPIQAQTIPFLLEGRDVLGQAQTGTGKTAAFALPALNRIDLNRTEPQVLVLAPTRELAIQVAEAFQKYAHHLKGFHVLPIYGGQDYSIQLRQLKRGPHVVVGTPGRVMDHMRRGTLKLDQLQTLVLDEADEMLRMGFIDDVKWVLEQTPPTRQIALFSATMPAAIRKIAEKHLNNPEQISIQSKTTTAITIRQRYWTVSGRNKMDVLTRILEAEPFEGIIIFVRTKTATVEIAEKLEARGYSAAALNGDIVQKQRELTVNRLKKGHLDIIVATDVAARGLDVERISHVINYDVPHDTESYVHRIGRTGRAGRSGEAILFIAPREQRMLSAIERATRSKIERLVMPTTESINDRRISEFKQRITDRLETEGDSLEQFTQIIEQYCEEHDIPATQIAAALAIMAQGDKPLLLKDSPKFMEESTPPRRSDRGERGERGERRERSTNSSDEPPRRRSAPLESRLPRPDRGMERYRLDVGEAHGVKVGNIVGAIANELGIESEFIAHVEILDDHSSVDLPEGMPKQVLEAFRGIRVSGRKLNAEKAEEGEFNARRPMRPKPRGKGEGRREAGGERKEFGGERHGPRSGGRPSKPGHAGKGKPGKGGPFKPKGGAGKKGPRK